MKSKMVEFTPPKDVAIPEGATPGEDFDLVCTFRLGDKGTVILTRMGDAEMMKADAKDKMAKENKPGYDDMAKGMMTTMQPDA